MSHQLVIHCNECATLRSIISQLKESATLKRNTAIKDTTGFSGEWVAIPKEDFDRLHDALSAAMTKMKE